MSVTEAAGEGGGDDMDTAEYGGEGSGNSAGAFQGMDADDDEALQLALAMSMADDNASSSEPAAAAEPAAVDPAFLNQLLGSLPGVDADAVIAQEEERRRKDQEDKDAK
jgi:hypothetical protein